MNLEQNKLNAPNGTTHYGNDGGYLKMERGKWFVWNNIEDDWMEMIPNEAWFEKYQYKPL